RSGRESSVSEESEHIPSSFTLCDNDPAATRRCYFKSPPVALAVTSLTESQSSSPASNFIDVFANEVAAHQIDSVSLIQYRFFLLPFSNTPTKPDVLA
ncbi:hypothetical protein NL676_002666, partial [Syzygium grande]